MNVEHLDADQSVSCDDTLQSVWPAYDASRQVEEAELQSYGFVTQIQIAVTTKALRPTQCQKLTGIPASQPA